MNSASGVRLPVVTFQDLRVGTEIFDLQIHGKGEEVEIDVLRGDPSRVRRRSFAAASEMLGAAQARD